MPNAAKRHIRNATGWASSHPTVRRLAIHIAKAIVGIVLLGACLSLIDTRGAVAQIASLDVYVFFAALSCALLGTIIFPALIVRRALEINKREISLSSLIAINLALRFYVIALPRIVATAIRWTRYGGGRFSADAFALMVYERIVQFAALFLFSLAALLADAPRNTEWLAPLTVLLAAGAAISLVALASFHVRPSHALFAKMLQWLEGRLPAFMLEKLERLLGAASAFRGLSITDIAVIAANSTAAFIFFVLSSFLIARSIGLDIGLLPLVWIRSAVFVITLIPVSVAGIGLREISFIGLLSLYGVSKVDALAFSLANFSVQLVIAAMGLAVEAAGFANGRLFSNRNARTEAES